MIIDNVFSSNQLSEKQWAGLHTLWVEKRMRISKNSYAWIVVILLLVVWLLNYLDRQVIFSIFPLLQSELHVSTFQLGLLGTAFLWVYAVCSPWAGHLADRFGKKRLICGSLLVWSAITAFSGRAHSFNQLIVLRGLMGISEACYLPAGLALIAAYHGPRTRSRAISLHYSGTYIGTVLGGVLGGWIGSRYGWRSVFGLFGIIGCVYGVVLLFALRENKSIEGDKTQSETPLRRAAATIFATTGYTKILAVFAVASICDWSIYTWMPLYLFEAFHFSLAKAGFTATFYIKAGGFAGLLLGGVIADAWAARTTRGRAWTQSLGLLCAAPCLIFSGLTHSALPLCVAMAIFGLGKGMYDGNTMPLLCEGIPPHLRATAFGFLNFAGTLSGGVIAAAAGALKSTLGLGGTFVACGLLLFAAGLFMASIRVGQIPSFD
jgi:MFS family permease